MTLLDKALFVFSLACIELYYYYSFSRLQMIPGPDNFPFSGQFELFLNLKFTIKWPRNIYVSLQSSSQGIPVVYFAFN